MNVAVVLTTLHRIANRAARHLTEVSCLRERRWLVAMVVPQIPPNIPLCVETTVYRVQAVRLAAEGRSIEMAFDVVRIRVSLGMLLEASVLLGTHIPWMMHERDWLTRCLHRGSKEHSGDGECENGSHRSKVSKDDILANF